MTLLERKSIPGGRASSYDAQETGETVDNCQHVLMRCCTNLWHFYEKAGVSSQVRWLRKLQFLEGVFDGGGDAKKDGDEGFDADAAIVTGELGALLPALMEALGGETTPGQAAAPASAAAKTPDPQPEETEDAPF